MKMLGYEQDKDKLGHATRFMADTRPRVGWGVRIVAIPDVALHLCRIFRRAASPTRSRRTSREQGQQAEVACTIHCEANGTSGLMMRTFVRAIAGMFFLLAGARCNAQ